LVFHAPHIAFRILTQEGLVKRYTLISQHGVQKSAGRVLDLFCSKHAVPLSAVIDPESGARKVRQGALVVLGLEPKKIPYVRLDQKKEDS
jgi:hypothetical protein